MADLLSVDIKVNVDDQQSRSKIESLKKDIKKIDEKIKVSLNQQSVSSIKQSLTEAINDVVSTPIVFSNVSIDPSNIQAQLQQIQNTAINIPVNVTGGNCGGNGGGSNGNGGGGNGASGSGSNGAKPWNKVHGARRADADVRALAGDAFDKYAKKLTDKGRKLSVAKESIRYNNSTGEYNAIVRYTNGVGEATKVTLAYDAAKNKVKRVSTEFIKDIEKENKIVEQNNKAQKKAQEYALKKKTGYENKISKLGTNATKNGYTTGSQIYKDYEDAVKKAESLVNGIGNSITQNTISDIDKAIQDVENKLVLANKKQKEENDANIGLGKGNFDEGMKNASEWLKSYNIEAQKYAKYSNEIKNTQESLTKELGAAKTTEDINNFSNSIKIARKELQNFKNENKNLLSGLSTADNINEKIAALTNYTTSLDSGKLDALGTNGITQLKTQINALSKEYDDLRSKFLDGNMSGEEFDKATARVQELNKEFTKMSTTMKNVSNKDYMDIMNSKIDTLKAKYAAFADEAGAALNVPELRAQYEALGKQMETVNAVNFSTVNAQFNAFVQQVRSAGVYTKTFAASFKDAFKQITGLYSVASVLRKVVSGFREVITNVTELNSCMTELRKVTNETETAYANFLNNAGSKAQELGTTMTDYISSVSDFSKLGYNFQDSQKLAETANIYYKVGDGLSSIDDSSQSIISTMKAFGIAAEDSLGIVDLYNEIGNKFAVTSGNIGLAMQSAGAALHSSNNSLEQSVALYTAMDEIIQDQSTSSTAIKFISQRLRNTSGALTEMGEDADGAVESITKLQQQIYTLSGVNIFEKDNETFRSTYDILKDISDVWSDLNDKNRADLTRLIAGTRQASTFSALMTNFSQAEKVVSASEQAAGSAEKEHSRWSQSIEAASARATAAVQNFSKSFMNSDLIKFTYDAETGILGFLTAIIDKVGALPLAMSAISGLLSTKNIGLWSKNSTTGMYSWLGKNTLAKGLDEYDRSFFGTIGANMINNPSANESISVAMAQAGISMNDFSEAGTKVIENLNQQNISGAAAGAMLRQYSGSLKDASKIGSSFSNVLSGIGNALLNMGIAAAAGLIVKGITEIVDSAITTQSELEEAVASTANEVKAGEEKLSSLNSELENTKKLIAELKGSTSINARDETAELERKVKLLQAEITLQNKLNQIAYDKKRREATAAISNKTGQFGWDDFGIESATGAIGRAFAGTDYFDKYTNSVEGFVNIVTGGGAIQASKDALVKLEKDLYNAQNDFIASPTQEAADKVSQITSDIAEIETVLSNAYYYYRDMLGDNPEKYTGAILDEQQIAYNKAVDEYNAIADIFVDLSSTRRSNEFNLVAEQFASGFELIKDSISNGVDITVSELEDKYPEIIEAFETYGWLPEEVAQYMNEMFSTADTINTTKFDSIASGIYSTTDAYKTLTSAMDEQASAGSISLETYRTLIETIPEAAQWLDKTANGWQLNTDAVNEYIKSQDELKLAEAIVEYDKLNKALEDTTGKSDADIKAMQEERNNLLMLISTLDSATGAFYKYKQAKETANSGDMFDSAKNMYEEYKKIRETGRTETDEFQAMTEFILGEGWNKNLDLEGRRKAYETAEKQYKRYFGQDKDYTGAENFMKDLLDKNMASYDKQSGWMLNQEYSIDELASATGMSADAVKSLIGVMQEFGAEFDIKSGITDKQVEESQKVIDDKTAAEALGTSAGSLDTSATSLTDSANDLSSAAADLSNAAGVMSGDNTNDQKDEFQMGVAVDKPLPKSVVADFGNAVLGNIADVIDNGVETANKFKENLSNASNDFDKLRMAIVDTAKEKLSGETQYDGTIIDFLIEAASKTKNYNTQQRTHEDEESAPVESTQMQQVSDVLGSVFAFVDRFNENAEATSNNMKLLGTALFDTIKEKTNSGTQYDGTLLDLLSETVQKASGGITYALERRGISPKENEITHSVLSDVADTAKEYASQISYFFEDAFNTAKDNSKGSKQENDPYSMDTVIDTPLALNDAVDASAEIADNLSNANLSINEINSDSDGIGDKLQIDDSDIQDAYQQLKNMIDVVGELNASGNGSPELEGYMNCLLAATIDLNAAYTNLKNTDPADMSGVASATSALNESASNFVSANNKLASYISTIPDANISVFANTNPAASAIDRLSNKIVKVTVQFNYVGQKYASGTINAKQGMSLVDEKGAELIEHTSRGTFELGTNNGARFTSLDAGDVVHDAAETKSILKRLGTNLGGAFSKGYNTAKSVITGRAFATVDKNYGTSTLSVTQKKKLQSTIYSALSSITTTLKQKTGLSDGSNKSSSGSSGKKKSSGGGGGGSSSSSSSNNDYLSNLFDWVEVKLTRLEEITEEWIAKAAEAIGYTAKNANLDEALKSTKDEIEATTQALAKYNEQAATVASTLGLSAEIIEKVKNGTIEIASYDSDMQSKINGYKDYIDKAVSASQKLYDLREQLGELASDQLKNIQEHYEWLTDRLDAVIDKSDTLIDLKNSSGVRVLASDYDDAITSTTSKLATLADERNALVEEFTSLVKDGYITEGTEQWYDYQSMIEKLDETVIDTKVDLIKLQDAVAEINITNLKYAMTYLESVATTVSDLMSLHEAQGIDATEDDYKKLIDNGMEQIKNLEAQNDELYKQLNGLDEMSEKYQDINNTINDNLSSIMSIKTQQEEWLNSIVDVGIVSLQKYQEELQKVNEKYQRQKELQQSIEDLEKARTQRTQRVYRAGTGWVYEADQQAIQDAQENFDQVLHNETISKLDDIIEALDDLKDDNNIYDANGNLLGTAYSLPDISDYSALLASVSSQSVVADALESTRKAIADEIINSIDTGNTNSISIGDVYVQGAEDANGLAQAIIANLGNAILQQLYNK